MLETYNLGIDPEDQVKLDEALAYFGIAEADFAKIDGTGPWVKESYGEMGDCFDPDWAELGHPEYDIETPEGVSPVGVVVHDDLLIVQCSQPGQYGRDWMVWCFVK